VDSVEIVLRPLGNVRYFFIFILAWSMISNCVFNYYSVSITTQLFGNRSLAIPRYVYTLATMVICIVMSIAGRNQIYAALGDLMAIIGYWTIIYTVIFVEEHFIFRVCLRRGWDLQAWNDKAKLPKGYAAMLAFCIGSVGSILGMSQAWYIGVVGRLIGEHGGDLGIWMGLIFAGVVYPLVRWVELNHYGV
jgi:purine-cytosine permease-like protein